MALDELIKEAIRTAGKGRGKFTLSVGIVKSIDGDICAVDEFTNVRLNAIIASLDSQFTVYPVVGSNVVVARLEGEDDAFVCGFSEIEKVTVKIGEQLLELYNGKFTIKNGDTDLKAILNDTYSVLKSAIINTPSGPGKFSPADVQKFEELNNQVNQLLQ